MRQAEHPGAGAIMPSAVALLTAEIFHPKVPEKDNFL
jgi:hypothetical protein